MGKRALVCGHFLPEFDRESGSRRVFDLIQGLRAEGWSVTYVARDARGGERYVEHLQQLGIPTYNDVGSEVEDLVASGEFDLAVLAFWHVAEAYLPVIRRLSPATRVIVDSVDLHFVRTARRALREPRDHEGEPDPDSVVAAKMLRELRVYSAADAVITVSAKEAALLEDLLTGGTPVHTVPDSEELSLSAIPFEDRQGIVFVGNFRHHPNVDAMHFLCREIVPALDTGLLARHPILILGNGLTEDVRALTGGLAHVRPIGWVPSLVPYLERAVASILPLRYGAGTKRKLIQAMMVGTPTVSTTIGVEGLGLKPGRHVLLADDPAGFARSIERLVQDRELWHGLRDKGRAHIETAHSHDAASTAFLAVVSEVLQRPPKQYMPAPSAEDRLLPREYVDLKDRVQEAVREAVPSGSTVLVVSRGDEELLALDGRKGWHFPQADGGVYAGYYPAGSAAAIAHLEALRAKGGEYLLLPRTSLWWLDHYPEFGRHLEQNYPLVARDESCLIFALREPTRELPGWPREVPSTPLALPTTPLELAPVPGDGSSATSYSVLLLGVYLAAGENHVDHVVSTLAGSKACALTQRWIALGGPPPTEGVADVTVAKVREPVPKFELVNGLLAEEDLRQYDYVVLADDDILLPPAFLDRFISLQARLGFSIAQPARTGNSYIDHPIVERQLGVVARQTLFVEIGPVVSFHRSAYDLVFPFDLTSSMGWGYENVWAYRLLQRGLKMGIIDAVPVDHSLRKPVANYSWDRADRERTEYLAKHEHLPLDRCFTVLDVIPMDRAG